MMNAPIAVMGMFEYFLIAVAVLMMIGAPLGVIVGLLLWQRGQRVPPAVRQPQAPDDGTQR
mgnify:CR=1 FL=1